MHRSNRDLVTAFWDDVWSQGNVDVLPQIMAEDATENGEKLDLHAFGEGVTRWRGKFIGFRAQIEELLEAGDRVVSRVTYTGTQAEPWAGIPATGRSFSTPGIDIFRIHDGKIAELWHSADHLDLVQQLGGKIVPKDE